MNIVSATILRNSLADTLSEIITKRDYFLIVRRGKISAALVNIDVFEDLLALANKKYKEGVKKARDEYKKGDIFTHAQVFGEV